MNLFALSFLHIVSLFAGQLSHTVDLTFRFMCFHSMTNSFLFKNNLFFYYFFYRKWLEVPIYFGLFLIQNLKSYFNNYFWTTHVSYLFSMLNFLRKIWPWWDSNAQILGLRLGFIWSGKSFSKEDFKAK